jgi:ribonuclease R
MGKPAHKISEAATPVTDVLTDIYAAYTVVKQARERRAPLEIDMPERRVHVDAKGKVSRIEVRARFDAHKLVEEFMIQANVAAAQALERKNAQLIFRVHDTPEREKLQGLADFLPALGLKWSLGERPTAKRFNRLIDFARKKDLAETVSMSVLRSQMPAYYGPKNGGHFGLNLTHYTHFTSPIRRYADLIVHRALVFNFGLGEGGSSAEELSRLKEISERISDTERRAMAAERNAKDRYIAAFLQDKIDVVFDARISGVTRAGIFLTLDETGADGYVPISKLGLERFIVDEKLKCLVGAQTGDTYKFGARVQARLLEASPVSGGLVFEITSEPEKGKPPKHTSHHGSYRGSNRGKPRKHKNRRR